MVGAAILISGGESFMPMCEQQCQAHGDNDCFRERRRSEGGRFRAFERIVGARASSRDPEKFILQFVCCS